MVLGVKRGREGHATGTRGHGFVPRIPRNVSLGGFSRPHGMGGQRSVDLDAPTAAQSGVAGMLVNICGAPGLQSHAEGAGCI